LFASDTKLIATVKR